MACVINNLNMPGSSSSSVSSSSSIKYDWDMLEGDLTESVINLYIQRNSPKSSRYQTNNNIKCYFFPDKGHKLRRHIVHFVLANMRFPSIEEYTPFF